MYNAVIGFFQIKPLDLIDEAGSRVQLQSKHGSVDVRLIATQVDVQRVEYFSDSR